MPHETEDGICKRDKTEQNKSPHQRYIDPLPEGRAYSVEPFRTEVLGDKGAHISGRAEKKAHDGEAHHTCRHGRRDGLGRVPGEKHPVDKVLH